MLNVTVDNWLRKLYSPWQEGVRFIFATGRTIGRREFLMANGVEFHHAKFKAAIHYICWKAGADPKLEQHMLTAVKMHKILWYSDRQSYERYGEAVTGARYKANAQGPIARAYKPVADELLVDGAISIREPRWPGDSTLFTALTKPDTTVLSNRDLAVLEKNIEDICLNHTSGSISDASHDELWKLAIRDNEDIPYFTVFASRRGRITEADLTWAHDRLQGIPTTTRQ